MLFDQPLMLIIPFYITIYVILLRRLYKVGGSYRLSFYFLFLSLFAYGVSPLSSRIMYENYIVPGWRYLGNDSWFSDQAFSTSVLYFSLSLIFAFLFNKIEECFFVTKIGPPQPKSNKNTGILKFLGMLVFIYITSYITMYYKLGITGVETPTEFRISGLLYFVRLLLAPILFVYLLKDTKFSFFGIFLLSLTIYIISLSEGSRLIAFMLYSIALFFWYNKKSMGDNLVVLAFCYFTIGCVTLGRSLMYDENIFDLNYLIVSPFFHDFGIANNFDFFVDQFDVLLLRIGGFHEVFHVGKLIENLNDCASYTTFFEHGRICDDVGRTVFGLEGDGKFGMNLGLISQFLMCISSDNFLLGILYISFYVVSLIYFLFLMRGKKAYRQILMSFMALNFFLGHSEIIALTLLIFTVVNLSTLFFNSKIKNFYV